MAAKPNFEQFLVETNTLSAEVLKQTQTEAASRRVSLFQALVEKKLLTDEALAAVLAKFHNVEFRPAPLQFQPNLVSKIPLFTLRRYKIIPLSADDKEVVLASVDPGNFLAADEVKRLLRLTVRIVCVTESAIQEALLRVQNPQAATAATAATAASGAPRAQVTNTVNANAATSDQADLVIMHAIERAASDIHIEFQKDGGVVRERIDGVLYDASRMSVEQITPLISRLKLLAGMDIVEKRLAQDGRYKFKHKAGECEIRASILPTIHGEKLVLRLLRNDRLDPTIEMLDMGKERMDLMKTICDLPDGLVIVAGPTGSGKSTTIFALLRSLDRKSLNVITVEDPVEYELDHSNQVQVNNKIGITFASTLPFILRQDPDVLMIGEVRDEETAQMVMRAAISGHLVFSTIHAPGCLDTVIRLVDMKVEPHMVVAALKAVISQRLLRKLCPKCKTSYPASSAEKKSLKVDEKTELKLFKPVGCAECHKIGYSGRFAAVEILFMSPAVQEAVVKNERKNLLTIARSEGFKTLHEHAIERVLAGDTSVKELLATCPEIL